MNDVLEYQDFLFNHYDRMIEIIRDSSTKISAAQKMMAEFNISPKQAGEILNLPIGGDIIRDFLRSIDLV